MLVRELEIEIPRPSGPGSFLLAVGKAVQGQLGAASVPIRFVVADSSTGTWRCEVAVIDGVPPAYPPSTLFQFVRRSDENVSSFNVVLVIPTGVGCAIGGHAGDANPVVNLMAAACDTLITHPNAVNASDLNELPANALYVEGSALTRLLMGTAGLKRVRANRVLSVVEKHPDEAILHATLNSVAAAEATFALHSAGIALVDPSTTLASHFTASGRAAGTVQHLDRLVALLAARRGDYDAIALSTRVAVDPACRVAYFRSHGELVNPWGGVEALLTHSLSALLDVPAAHAPMYESPEVANEDPGIVDPRMAAEAISVGFFMCVLKGLRQSPRLVSQAAGTHAGDLVTSADVSCLVIPAGCLGLPVLAALEQRIPVIAVCGNTSIMRNDLADLPWAPGQYHEVQNYVEAAGLLIALRRGIAPAALRRPLHAPAIVANPPVPEVTRRAPPDAAAYVPEI